MAGHLFQGRYKAILVQKETHLLELSRYVVLNPMRAGMVDELKDWRWSSYPAIVGLRPCPDWLDSDWLLSQFAKYRKTAINHYQAFIHEGKGIASPLNHV